MRRNRLFILCLCLIISLAACQRSPATAPTQAAQPGKATLPPTLINQEQPTPIPTPTGESGQSDLVATKAPTGTPQPEASATPVIESPTPSLQDTVVPPTDESLPTATFEETATESPSPLPPTPTLTPEHGPITLVDGMGREVSLDGPAVRIVSLAASNTEILFAINAGPQTAGRDDFSDQPAEALILPSVGGTDGSYDMGLLTDLAPDLVLLAGSNSVNHINAMEDAGFTYFYVHDPATLEEFFGNIRSLGILTGQEPAAESLVTSLQDRVDNVISALSGVTERPIVFYEREINDTYLPWTCGRQSIINELLFIAGATNAAEGLDGDWVQIRLDALTIINPDLILLGDTLYGVTPEDVLIRPGWENIKAVIETMIVPFDDTLFSRPGPGLIEGLESLAATIHPDRFN